MTSTVQTEAQQRSAAGDQGGGEVPRGGVVVGFDGSAAALEAVTWAAAEPARSGRRSPCCTPRTSRHERRAAR